MPQPHPRGRSDARATTTDVRARLTSPAFADGSSIPRRFTADGDDISPRLTWTTAPPGTVSFALVCEDPDAPSGTFVHWLVWHIPADRRELREGLPKMPTVDGMLQGENGFHHIGWGGPSPPPGKPHRYVFRLFALDAMLGVRGGARRAELDRAMEGHVLSEATLIGTYGR